jgi:amidase
MTWTSATCTALAAAIRKRELSSREVVSACLERIERVNPRLNAIITLDAEGALARADALDAALARGELAGPLHGVPFTLKDGHDTAGMRTTFGHKRFAANVPREDGAVAARLRAAGAVLLGKTNVPALLASAQTDNALFGRTNNPWDLARTPGGSSGGAAAAVAASLVPFDVGSDLSGSIRMPASYCGVFGLKPTVHRLPTTGHMAIDPKIIRVDRIMGVVGPITRSVADLALVTSVLAGPDGRDVEVPPVPWRDAPPSTVRGLRVAFRESFPGVPTSRAVKAVVARVAKQLEEGGARVEDRDPAFTKEKLDEVWREYMRVLGSLYGAVTGASLPASVGDEAPPTAVDYVRVLSRRDALIVQLESLFDEIDVFLTPAVPSTAFPHGPPRSPMPIDGEMVESRFVDHYLYPFGFTGNPCVVVPGGLAEDGLPVGVQLVGRRWGDERLLSIASAVSDSLGAYRAPPDIA